jgi:hypothetical protein
VTRDELASRHKVYTRERAIVAAFGYAPLLLLYVLVHTKYLRPYVPESRGQAVLVMIVMPILWFALLMMLHRWLGPLRHKLRCPACGQRFVGDEYHATLEAGRCVRCLEDLAGTSAAPFDGAGAI